MKEKHTRTNTKQHSDTVIGIATMLSGHSPKIQIFPAEKVWYGADGRGPYRLSNPDAVVERSQAPELLKFAMLDRDHAKQLAPKGTPIKAAGWFTGYEVHEDGSIWGSVDWTPQGKSELENKEFRYFSATFYRNKSTGEILAIVGGTITNSPNFENMQAIASKDKKPNLNPQEKDMNPQLIALATALGLDHETASEEQILAAAQKSHTALTSLQEGVGNIKKLLKLDDGAEIAAVEKAAKEAIEETATKAADPEKYVPKEMYTELAARLDKVEKDNSSKEAKALVEAAMKEGKLAPASKEWAEDYASKNVEGFKEFIKNQPVIVDGQTTTAAKHASENDGLSNEDIEVAKQLGVDPESLKAKK